MGIDNTPKRDSLSLPLDSFGKKVVILSEDHASQFGCSIQQFHIAVGAGTVLISCRDVWFPQAKSYCY